MIRQVEEPVALWAHEGLATVAFDAFDNQISLANRTKGLCDGFHATLDSVDFLIFWAFFNEIHQGVYPRLFDRR